MNKAVSGDQADFSAAESLLAARRYAEAWPLYEARKAIPGFSCPRPLADYPEWLDEDVGGKRVVVCAEQGFGDQIMFGRYLPLLRARGAEVTVACHPLVARLFSAAGYPICPLFIDRPLPPADFWTVFGSLPHRLGNVAPSQAHYLPIPWRGGEGVGVMTRGNPSHYNDARRSLFGADAERLHRLGRDLSPESTGAGNFLATAKLLASLDLVVTVDTAMAHLAGSMGVPCWVLLPAERLDWRWNDGVRSDWYPEMRLFRQPRDGDWGSALDQVETERI